jgi:hypothetical protein
MKNVLIILFLVVATTAAQAQTAAKSATGMKR